jgi:hypothetical protein
MRAGFSIVLMVLSFISACSKNSPGTRTPDADQHCGDKLAFAFVDQAQAERAGCSARRVYRQLTDAKTGKPYDDEFWVFCCPK